MGFDPSIELIESSRDSFFYIKVNEVQYKTLQMLQDDRTDILHSCGTHVFQVEKVGNSDQDLVEKETYVLKDMWSKKSWRLEHEIHADMTTDVGCLYLEEAANTVK